MTTPAYTPDPPATPGHYWRKDRGPARIAYVAFLESGTGWVLDGTGTPKPLAEYRGGLWAGPLPEPGAEAGWVVLPRAACRAFDAVVDAGSAVVAAKWRGLVAGKL